MLKAMCAALVLITGSAGIAQETPVEILPLTFSPAGLAGQGGDRLKVHISDARFVALGEDHGFAGPPQLGEALAADMRRLGPVAHAVEVGPQTTQQVAALLAEGGLPALDAALAKRPLAMPFLSNAEDAALALSFVQTGGVGSVWGIDQEFIASPLLLLEMLADLAPTQAMRTRLLAIHDADTGHVAVGAFDRLYLSVTAPADFDALRAEFPDNSRAAAIIDALAESAVVYQHNNAGRYLENNEARTALIQRYFLDALRSGKPGQRVLLKMGAYHLGRGTTPTAIFDIGSLLPGLAAAEGKASLHVVYMPMGGRVRSLTPGGETATAVKLYEDETVAPLLAMAGIAPDRVGSTGHVLIPLAPLRHKIAKAGKLKELNPLQKFLLIGYDYLVTTRDGQPATHFEAWAK